MDWTRGRQNPTAYDSEEGGVILETQGELDTRQWKPIGLLYDSKDGDAILDKVNWQRKRNGSAGLLTTVKALQYSLCDDEKGEI